MSLCACGKFELNDRDTHLDAGTHLHGRNLCERTVKVSGDEAEERRLERDVVEAAMRWAETAPTNGNIYSHRVLVKAVEDACARLSAFRKEKGTR